MRTQAEQHLVRVVDALTFEFGTLQVVDAVVRALDDRGRALLSSRLLDPPAVRVWSDIPAGDVVAPKAPTTEGRDLGKVSENTGLDQSEGAER